MGEAPRLGASDLDECSGFVQDGLMTIFLRKQRVQDTIEGRQTTMDWSDTDYAVIDGFTVGRIYAERLPAGVRWRWFLNGPGLPRAVQAAGDADTLDEAKAEIADRYRRAMGAA